MSRSLLARLSPLLGLLLLATLGVGQVATGTPPFGSFGGGPFDTVNLGNLNVHFAIPLIHKAGRGLPFNYDLSYDNSVWYPVGSNWQPVFNWGWRAQTEMVAGYVTYTTNTSQCLISGHWLPYTYWTKWAYHDPWGVVHQFPSIVIGNRYPNCGYASSSTSTKDGSGYSMTATYASGVLSAAVYPAQGGSLNPPLQSGSGAAKITDANGNQISVTTGGSFTDTLGTTVLTVTGTGTSTSPTILTYVGPNGSVPITVHYSNQTVRTYFRCSTVTDYPATPNTPLVSDVTFNDGSQYLFQYETSNDPNNPGSVTGRISQVTLPTGGIVQYEYSGGTNGINCADGSAATMTRTLAPGGAWTYVHSQVSGTEWKTTVTTPPDPQNQNSVGDDTVLYFQGIYETQRLAYQGSSTAGTLLRTLVTCYNNNLTNCNTTAIAFPITRRTVTLQLPGGKQSEVDSFYDTTGYGLTTEVDEYDFGPSGVGALIRKTLTSYGSYNSSNGTCVALANGIVDHRCQITVKDSGGTTKAQTSITYDESTPTSSGTTPQHISISGSRGNATTISSLVTSTTSLTRHVSYYDTGTTKTATDVNGNVTTYSYTGSSCGNSFPTQTTLSNSLPVTLTRSYAYDTGCNGGVTKSITDENGQPTTYGYTDPDFWRLTSITDPLANVTSITYPSTDSVERSLLFNAGISVVDTRMTVDEFGRPHLSQRLQGPGLTTYDSTETDYDAFGRASKVILPFGSTAGAICTGTCPGVTYTYDALNRATEISDAGGGDVSHNFAPSGLPENGDVLVAAEPPPAGELTKRRQMQADGLGRLSSVCEVTGGAGSGTCTQSRTQSGYFTQYTYDVLDNPVGVSQNAQSTKPQGRTFVYDMLGRLTSESNPETGTTAYTYDSASGCSGTFNGNLVKRVDALGNATCYAYDPLHRLTNATYTGPNTTSEKHFVYDTTTFTCSNGANVKARLAEAYTGASKTTDLGYCYSARGEITDVYETTAHSGGSYHVTASYFANGAVQKIQNLAGLPTITYGVDSEGRTKTVSASSGQNPVTNTVYNGAGEVTEVDFGSLDKDTFQYDPNTFRETQYKFIVGSSSVTGNLTWNPNGSLQTLGIVDGLNSSNTQTCNYGYDDLSRITSANCGAVWSQTFTFDPFGNISKSGSSSFAAGYLLADGSTNNKIQSLPGVTVSYDSDGNLTGDGTHTSSWNAEGNPTQVDSVSVTYDAFDRVVEQNRSGTYVQTIYSPSGIKLALMLGQALGEARIALPGGTWATYTPSGLTTYWHPDWLGSSRLATTPSRTVQFDIGFAPYGETYGQTGQFDLTFTGSSFVDTVYGMYDFMFREYNPVHGRWISPDPAGQAVANPANPQSWNRYAYVSNRPLTHVDPLGLIECAFYYPVWIGGEGGYLDWEGAFCFDQDDSSRQPDICQTEKGKTVASCKTSTKPKNKKKSKPNLITSTCSVDSNGQPTIIASYKTPGQMYPYNPSVNVAIPIVPVPGGHCVSGPTMPPGALPSASMPTGCYADPGNGSACSSVAYCAPDYVPVQFDSAPPPGSVQPYVGQQVCSEVKPLPQ